MATLVDRMDAGLYPQFGANWDDELFRTRVLARLTADASCLEFGAGRGNVRQMDFRGCARRIAGVDPDPAVFANPYLHEAAVLDLRSGRIPFEDASFDVVFADNVMEHVDDPVTALREVHRVLRPGGVFLAKTPNKWHYMPVIARATPMWFHRFYNRLRGRAVVDTFPTRYRCNTPAQVEAVAAASGFSVDTIELVEGRPEYLRITAPTYAVGWLWERLVNTVPGLSRFRCVLMFALRKA